MMNGVYVVASRMSAQRQELAAVADNVANINTEGFKRLVNSYQTVNTTGSGNASIGNFTRLNPTSLDQRSGAMQPTGNPLDLAIQGNGYFAVDNNGVTEYTKAGRFVLDAAGNIVTPEGHSLLAAGGGPLAVDPNSESIAIAPDGTIASELGVFGQVGVYDLSNEDQPIRAGGARFRADDVVALEPGTLAVLQGILEESNVNGMVETVRLTELNRAYQGAARAGRQMEDLQERAIRQLGAIPQ